MVKNATMTVSKSNLENETKESTELIRMQRSKQAGSHNNMNLSMQGSRSTPRQQVLYQMIESVERNEGIVSMVVITALRTIANETQTLSANAALLEDGSSRSRKSFLLKGF